MSFVSYIHDRRVIGIRLSSTEYRIAKHNLGCTEQLLSTKLHRKTKVIFDLAAFESCFFEKESLHQFRFSIGLQTF